ncbi:MAG: hypothetical protein WD535_05145 [Thermaerobacterales bacterium]
MGQPSAGDRGHSNLHDRAARETLLLIDEFEQFAAEAARLPLTGKALIDEDDLFAFIDQLRKVLPDDVRRAIEILERQSQIITDAEGRRDRILTDAQERRDTMLAEGERRRDKLLGEAEREAEQQVAEARRYAERLTSESVVVREAEAEAGRIVAEARQEAGALRAGADRYAERVLTRLEDAMSQTLSQIKQGRQYLHMKDGSDLQSAADDQSAGSAGPARSDQAYFDAGSKGTD